ncbi:ABC transporter substrate-binding protein [Haematospirillum sp. 15-248]|uniref:substrate-binding periplasmic protein n=1 Tax=Haematospirillum sp. 15-248 TaxID=2723107 RepID=UPI0014393B6E|nr:transporter substrate-binding domain-containing protein [Haematospirillum sp. 15-248]NKD88117.1 ABC transporter substrate-binding protein [Haematospirillum sp. 15-248]
MSRQGEDKKQVSRGSAVRACSVVLLSCTFFLVAPVSHAGELRLSTLEWPPYTGEALPGAGAAAIVLQEAAKHGGDTFSAAFYPWQWAVRIGLESTGYVGYFPEYMSRDLDSQCLFSKPIGIGPLGFAQRRDRPLFWNTLDDLASVPIGTVSGYVNTADFDARVAAGRLSTDTAIDDVSNLRKVIAKRVVAAVVDHNVMAYLLKTDSSLIAEGDVLEFNSQILENKTLHVCFRKTDEGEAARARLDAALSALDVSTIFEKALVF